MKSVVILKTFRPDNGNTYNTNDNPESNILLSENIRQKKTNNSGTFRRIYMHIFLG